MKKNIVALLPMKGNSERVPNKNLRLFNGKPLYHRVLNQLQKSKYIIDIVINTDSDYIKKDIRGNFPNVIIVDRPASIQGDFISMNEIIAYDIEQVTADIYLQTHSTSPLLNVNTVDNAIEKFLKSLPQNDSLFTVTSLYSRFYWGDGSPINHNPAELLRTQDLPVIYEENSNFYIFTNESFLNAGKKRIGLYPIMFPIDKIEAVDIDEPEDFLIAEAIHKLRFPL